MTTMLLNPVNVLNTSPFGGSKPPLPVLQKTLVQIVNAEVRGSRNSSGSNNTAGGAALTLQVLEGPYSGATGEDWLHLYPEDPSSKAGEIATQKLASYAYVTGQVNLGNDLRVLFNKPFRIDTVQTVDSQGNQRVNVTNYYDANGTPVTQVASQYKQPQQPNFGGAQQPPFNAQGAQPPAQQFGQPQQAPQGFGGAPQNNAPSFNPGSVAPIAGFGQPVGNMSPQGFGQAPAGTPQQPSFGQQLPQNQQPGAGFNQPPASAPSFGGGGFPSQPQAPQGQSWGNQLAGQQAAPGGWGRQN